MIKIFAAAALTIGGPIVLLVACYFVAKIPFVERCFDIDENDALFTMVSSGFMAIAVFIIVPICILVLLIALFNSIYGLL